MVAERDTATPTRAPGTKTGAMEAGSEASQVDCAGGGAPTRTPPSSNKQENSMTPGDSGLGSTGAMEDSPGAGSNSSGQGSTPVTKRDFNRVKKRFVHFDLHINNQIEEMHKALQEEKKERDTELPACLTKLVSRLKKETDETSAAAGAVDDDLQQTKKSIQEEFR